MMISISHNRISSRGLIFKFVGELRGTTAVEFAIIGPLFFALVFSALELGLGLTKVTLLDTAAEEISREIYIGNASRDTISLAQLKERICQTISSVVLDCENHLTLELTKLDSIDAVPVTDAICVDPKAEQKLDVPFNSGEANSIMYMRICLTTKILTPGVGHALRFADAGSQYYQIVASLAFMNEPF